MITVRDDLWLCVDCLMVACNGDESGIDSEARRAAVAAGLERLGTHLVPDFDSDTGEGIEEFSRRGCDCCGSRLAGGMHRAAPHGASGRTPKMSSTRPTCAAGKRPAGSLRPGAAPRREATVTRCIAANV